MRIRNKSRKSMNFKNISAKTRFGNNVDMSNIDGCWVWTGAKTKFGYGWFYMNNLNFKAHRVSWTNWIGFIPNHLQVLHKCDNPSCVRPDHLFLGSQKDNMADMVIKGRANKRHK